MPGPYFPLIKGRQLYTLFDYYNETIESSLVISIKMHHGMQCLHFVKALLRLESAKSRRGKISNSIQTLGHHFILFLPVQSDNTISEL